MEFIHSILESLGFNWQVALANFVNFLIILFVLNKFVFGKVVNLVRERDEKIKEGLNNAINAEENLKASKQQAEEIIHNSKREAEEILKTRIDEAQKESSRIVSDSKLAAANLENDLKLKIASAEESVLKEFGQYAPALLADLMKKTLARTMTREDHDVVVAQILKR